MRLIRLLIIYCIFISVPAAAQVPVRAAQYFDRALRGKAAKDDGKATEYMLGAIKEYPAYAEAYSILGEWCVQQRQYARALEVFTKASANCKNGHKAFAKPLARSMLLNYDYRGASSLISAYAIPGNKDWEQMKGQAAFMAQAMSRKWRDTAFNMGTGINSRHADMFPCLSADMQTIYFTRKTNGVDEDFYRSTPDSCGGWFYARSLGSPLSTVKQEYAQMISADGHYLFFTRCENKSENGWTQGGCDLLMAYTADSVWSVPQSFGATINTPGYEGMACLSPDNRELYFVSNREGGYGGLDIWVSRFESGLWQKPRNLGPGINTPGNEQSPFLHIDNKTLYFASDGLPGFGGNDLYYSRRQDDTTWQPPQNMGYPFNTTANELSLYIPIDGKKGFFASDRDSLEGNYDLYEINMPQQLQPEPVAILKGYVYDSLNKSRLNYTSIYINDYDTDEPLYHFVSNRGDGSFMVTLPVGRRYLCHADRIGYMDVTDTLVLNAELATHEETKNIALLPQDYVKPVQDSLIATIYFPRNSAQLTDSDKVALQAALAPWKEKDVLVMINGYTDNTGTPLINEQLSYVRADLVRKEISTLGIAEDALRTHGWGEADPVADNETEEGKSVNRRVEVIVRW